MCHGQSFKTMNLINFLVGVTMLCTLTVGTTKNLSYESQYLHLEFASEIPTILKCTSTKLVDDC